MVVYRSGDIPLLLSSSSSTAATLLRTSIFPVSASSSIKTCKLFTRSFNLRGRNLSPCPTLVLLMLVTNRRFVVLQQALNIVLLKEALRVLIV